MQKYTTKVNSRFLPCWLREFFLALLGFDSGRWHKYMACYALWDWLTAIQIQFNWTITFSMSFLALLFSMYCMHSLVLALQSTPPWRAWARCTAARASMRQPRHWRSAPTRPANRYSPPPPEQPSPLIGLARYCLQCVVGSHWSHAVQFSLYSLFSSVALSVSLSLVYWWLIYIYIYISGGFSIEEREEYPP